MSHATLSDFLAGYAGPVVRRTAPYGTYSYAHEPVSWHPWARMTRQCSHRQASCHSKAPVQKHITGRGSIPPSSCQLAPHPGHTPGRPSAFVDVVMTVDPSGEH